MTRLIQSKVLRHARRLAGRDLRTTRPSAREHASDQPARDLVIAYAFPPAADTSGMVAARRVREWGRPVDVISHSTDNARGVDPGSVAVTAGLVRRHHVVPGRASSASWAKGERFCRRGLHFIQRVEELQGPYRSVYSRSMWPMAHLLGALYKARHPGVPWTAEFSDPLLMDTHGQRRVSTFPPNALIDELAECLRTRDLPVPDSDNIYVWLEHLVYALADTVMFTNEQQRAYMTGYMLEPSFREEALARSVVMPHPTPDADLYQRVRARYRLSRRTVNIGYFGDFYRVRGIEDLLAALGHLDRRERRRVMLHVFTTNPEAHAPALRESGVGRCVRMNGSLPYLEFLNLATRLDWLVVTDARTDKKHPVNPYLPSKVSDYRGAGTPVWGIVEEGSPLSELPLQAVTPLGDDDAALRLLRELIAAPRRQ